MTAIETFTVGVAGASGYGGAELLRLVELHPHLRLATAQARSDGFDPLSVEELASCDVAFLALPHGASAPFGQALVEAGTPVVDLGSDFRVGRWAYGLPELFRDDLVGAHAVASPGCYATAATLAVAPLALAGLIDGPLAIDGKSGISGAGRSPSEKTHLPALHGGVTPYQATGHRHIAEIEQSLARLGYAEPVTFTPHLLPTSRGLLCTVYARLSSELEQAGLDELYRERYGDEPFVRLVDEPAPQRLAGSNCVAIQAVVDPRTGTAICFAALDNLVKGAAGQAIQNANLMLGLPETAGLPTQGLWP
jgi:N-acetyl-gamma-glutamyl-phosphate reductase